MDDEFRDFIFAILMMIEPRFLRHNEKLYDELETVEDMFFIMSGSVDVAFKINNKRVFVVRLRSGKSIGGYYCAFNEPSEYLYQCRSNIAEGYMLRKNELLGLKDDYEQLLNEFCNNFKQKYFTQIKFIMELERKAQLNLYKKRALTAKLVTMIPNDFAIQDDGENKKSNVTQKTSNLYK